VERLPLETQTLYAELLERLSAYEAIRSVGHLPGSYVSKLIKGRRYHYFQYLDVAGKKRQVYLGPQSAALDAFIKQAAQSRDDLAPDTASIHRLASLLRVGGAAVTDTPSAQVVRGLADAGVFRLGAVLVGTHAFTVLGNVLGVRWDGASLRTQDIDLAAHRRLQVAVPTPAADLPDALESLKMGFLPVPGLDPRAPSTSFKVRGQGLRVDLLTPSERHTAQPVHIARFAAAAQPLRFLDYVMEEPVHGALINGGAVLVSVPDPARFAIHKLLVAGERPVVAAAKREKDVWQAAQVLHMLLQDRPGDIARAVEALRDRGKGWAERVSAQLSALPEDTAAAISSLLGR